MFMVVIQILGQFHEDPNHGSTLVSMGWRMKFQYFNSPGVGILILTQISNSVSRSLEPVPIVSWTENVTSKILAQLPKKTNYLILHLANQGQWCYTQTTINSQLWSNHPVNHGCYFFSSLIAYLLARKWRLGLLELVDCISIWNPYWGTSYQCIEKPNPIVQCQKPNFFSSGTCF